ncbi:MAG: acyl carrier protein [Oscillospiraceae bacterium]|nr:acyl carrier protein [Oscillospiraceae bacterium]
MIFETLQDIIAEQFSIDPGSITPETTFADDLGADSLDVLELTMAIEEGFNIVIPESDDEEFAKMATVADVVKYISDRID